MESILKELFYGDIVPADRQPPIEYPELHKDLDEKLIDEFLDSYNKAQGDVPFHNFKQGFILGSKFMMEILQG
ncbi:MAG: hypothetical protein FWG33_02505 [Oscillospiraceae bacterium]|nr:hypothetical protein [Oscillospiraceae bacterium]